MNHHFRSTTGRQSRKRAYVKVQPERLQAFLALLQAYPDIQIKQAAQITQIKYHRATALARQYQGAAERQLPGGRET